jgi:uncharacterized membrane protein HdeD (DUF308 family)
MNAGTVSTQWRQLPNQFWEDIVAIPGSASSHPRTFVPEDSQAYGAVSAEGSWLFTLVAAICTFAFGLIVLVWPKATVSVIAILLGIQLLAFGIIGLINGITGRDEGGGMRAAAVVLGLLGIAAGVYCIRHLSVTVALLAFLVGLYWVLHGIVDLVVAVTAAPIFGRWFKAATGVISLAAGLLVIFEPKATLTFLLVVLGIYLMLYGVLLALYAVLSRHEAAQASR